MIVACLCMSSELRVQTSKRTFRVLTDDLSWSIADARIAPFVTALSESNSPNLIE